MNLKIKICGMREPSNIRKVSELRPDIIGFIFHHLSPRYAGEMPAKEILSSIPPSILKAGVFVNEDEERIISTAMKYSLDIVQLHGDETPDLCRRLQAKGLQVIKAFSMNLRQPFSKCPEYMSVTDYFLFDAPRTGSGGSGEKFNWEILKEYDLQQPFFLSGGISPEDTGRIREINNPAFCGIDLNSRFEIKPGIKNIELLGKFITGIKS
jgi:phosphoribosylanthranilate isomerase